MLVASSIVLFKLLLIEPISALVVCRLPFEIRALFPLRSPSSGCYRCRYVIGSGTA